jgi:hypothetical protein
LFSFCLIKNIISHILLKLKDKKQNLLTLPEELFEKDENKEIKSPNKDEDLEDETDLDQPITIKMLYQSIIKVGIISHRTLKENFIRKPANNYS